MITEFKGEHRWLSNFWPCEIIFEGYTYPTVEHAYQAAKTTVDSERLAVRFAETPGQAKRLGRELTLRKDWEMLKLGLMRQLLMQKFSYTDLRTKLLLTDSLPIQEGNYWGDQYWGVDLRTGQGQNNLGKLLMEIRGQFRHPR